MRDRCCLGCDYWKLITPPGEKEEEFYPYSWMRKNDRWLTGHCTLNPEWLETKANHYCGQQSGHDGNATDLLYGSPKERMADAADIEIKRLRAQLKAARAISRSRLARLKAKPDKITLTPCGG